MTTGSRGTVRRAPAAFAAVLCLAAGTPPLGAEATGLTGPQISAASNMAQGRQEDLIDSAIALGVTDFRDGVYWAEAEQVAGTYTFDTPMQTFPDALAKEGATVSLTHNWGNPLYDDGATPHTPEAIAAFGAFAGAVAERFPNMTRLEIGNEFNGVNFVSGPVREMTAQERALAYTKLLEASDRAARAANPDIKILGGATHSIPAGYLWTMFDAGAANWMDAIAIHPYTTHSDQFARQIEVLRRHPEARGLPIEVTEFGDSDPATAAGHLVRNYCQMALSGVQRVVWYPLNDRNDGLVPLISPEGSITPAGRAFRLVAELMEGRPVTDASPDPFTYGCRFGSDVLVIWGASREVSVPQGTEVLDAAGAALAPPYALSPDAPLVLRVAADAGPVALDAGQPGLVADSFAQFFYPQGDEARAAGDAFERFARRDGRIIPLRTLPGQERSGTPWFPYRGNPDAGVIRLTADSLVPGGTPDRPTEIVHRYVAPEAMTVRPVAEFSIAEHSEDGITVTATLNGENLFTGLGSGILEFSLPDLKLEEGDILEISVGPNQNPKGDVVGFRIRLFEP